MQDVVSQSKTRRRSETSVIKENIKESGSRDLTVQAIVRAFEVLDAFRDTPQQSVTELSRRLHLHKSTVHRLLATLERVGYVVQDEVTQHYSLGLRVLDLAAAVSPATDVRQRALPTMQQLKSLVQETIHLGVLVDGEVTCIESVASERPVAVMRLVGKRGPAHVSSMGKVLLADQGPTVLDRVIADKGLPRLTRNTITDDEAFREHLAAVRLQGWAVNAEEEELGVGCVAAPIRDYRGRAIAALSIAAPSVRMQGEDLDRLCRLVKEGAQEVSRSLGYTGAT